MAADTRITRFDHLVIGVADLGAAMADFGAAGFEVVEGGRHPGRGTRNALVRFGLDYLELITVEDEREALAASGNSAALARGMAGAERRLVGFALAVSDIDGLAAAFGERGLEPSGPAAMSRRRPDGRVLSWRLLFPFPTTWFTPWPFLIAWDEPDEQRLRVERPGSHRNMATRVAGLRIATADLERAAGAYQRMGLGGGLPLEEPGLAASGRSYRVGDVNIDLLTPARGEGPVAEALERGEGPFEAVLAQSGPAPSSLDGLGVRLTFAAGSC